MILSRAQLEEIAAAVTDDFDRFFFGVSPEEEREDILPTPIDQLAKGKATGPRMRQDPPARIPKQAAEKKRPFLFWKPCQSGKEGGKRDPSGPRDAMAGIPAKTSSDRQWYPCPATVSNNGGSPERTSGE